MKKLVLTAPVSTVLARMLENSPFAASISYEYYGIGVVTRCNFTYSVEMLQCMPKHLLRRVNRELKDNSLVTHKYVDYRAYKKLIGI